MHSSFTLAMCWCAERERQASVLTSVPNPIVQKCSFLHSNTPSKVDTYNYGKSAHELDVRSLFHAAHRHTENEKTELCAVHRILHQ